MRKKSQLYSREIIWQDILRVLLLLIILIVLKGMYNESNNINQNNILVPNFLIIAFIFCIVYGVNAFTTGNVVKNWVNYQIFDIVFNFVKSRKMISDDKAMVVTTKIFGAFILGLGFLLFFSTVPKISLFIILIKSSSQLSLFGTGSGLIIVAASVGWGIYKQED